MLEREYFDDARLKDLDSVLGHATLSPAWEHLVRNLAKNAKDRDVRGLATLQLGRMLRGKAIVRKDPWFEKPTTPFQRFLTARLDAGFSAYCRDCDADATQAESMGLLKLARQEFGAVSYRKSTVADVVNGLLAEDQAKRDGK
jgi:hypothetical protein